MPPPGQSDGLVGCASVDDYLKGVIRKHELTRPDKEEDRKNHIRITNFNAEPVFFAYPDNKKIDAIVNRVVSVDPEFDFTADDGVNHKLWCVSDDVDIRSIQRVFSEEVPNTYVADGHHRTAAAALVGGEERKNNPSYSGMEEAPEKYPD